VFSGSTSWLPPGWNSPYTGRRSDDDCFNSAAASYADRPRVEAPHALHFMGMTPAARYRAMAEERARAGLSPARAQA
jgi:molybdopterin-biosynthesis enzyme MoeA-like protein